MTQRINKTVLTIQVTGIKRQLIPLPIGKEINELIGFPDLLLAQPSELVVGQSLRLTLSEIVKGRWLKTRDGIWINRFDLLGLEDRKLLAGQGPELTRGQA